jgi:hypothetical protein
MEVARVWKGVLPVRVTIWINGSFDILQPHEGDDYIVAANHMPADERRQRQFPYWTLTALPCADMSLHARYGADTVYRTLLALGDGHFPANDP